MPHLTVRIPKYRLHKPSGRAVVTLGGHDIYLGRFGSPESKAEYNRVVAEWQLARISSPTSASPAYVVTVNEVIRAYLGHVERYYLKNGSPTSSQTEIRRALRPLHDRYGEMSVDALGPMALKALRESLIGKGTWCRSTINKSISIVKRMFKWATENELVS